MTYFVEEYTSFKDGKVRFRVVSKTKYGRDKLARYYGPVPDGLTLGEAKWKADTLRRDRRLLETREILR